MKQGDAPIVVSQEFENGRDVVWLAITEVDQMRQWFFENIPAFEARVGFKTQFNVHNEGRDFMHLWEIVEVRPGTRIVYDWRYANLPGEGSVVFELSEQDDRILLTLTNTILENFPQDMAEFTDEACRGGWSYFINDRLKTYLAGLG